MMHSVLILDTSVLCCWLRVPGKETSGRRDDLWDGERVQQTVNERLEENFTLVLPFASLLETGNHISQAAARRFELATELANMLRKSANGEEPWATFAEQGELFTAAKILEVAGQWPTLANGGMSIGDYLIKDVAEFYARAGMYVEILTGDSGLKAYEPAKPLRVPRRRTKHSSTR